MSVALISGYGLACFLYLFYAYLNYSNLKDRWWYIPLGLLVTCLSNLIWLLVTKIPSSTGVLLIRGVVWDVMTTATFMVVPFLFMGFRLSGWEIVGFGVCLVGLLMMKLNAG